jgi:hypothetical protein
MENQTRFDLNAAVENWRNELAAQPNLASDDRRELETHLRDAIAGFQQRGLNDEESFWLARRRVGQPQPLGEEFEKADLAKVWRERVFWMVLAYLVISLWGASENVFFNFFSTSLVKNTSIGTTMFYGNCFRLIFDWLPILVCAWLLAKGRLGFNYPKLVVFFRSRSHLAIASTSWIFINSGVTIWYRLQSLKLTNSGYASSHIPAIVWANLWSNLFYITIWPLLLVTLLIWLMSPQNRKTPKRA